MNKSKWTYIKVSTLVFAPRVYSGVIQQDESNILIFGGLTNGGFLDESYIFDTEKEEIKKIGSRLPVKGLFRSNPVILDNQNKMVYAID